MQNNETRPIGDLNLRPEIMKLLEENLGSKLFHSGLSDIFLDMSSWAKATKAKINNSGKEHILALF